ncbi:MAG: hypothetical protein WC670_13060 [Pseudolabrys sp.]
MKLVIRAAAAAVWLAAVLVAPGPATAQDIKPVFSVKTRSIEASLKIDPRLKAYPKLYAGLLAEGKREVEKWRRSADEDRKATPDDFAGGQRYAFERKYTQSSAIGRYIGVDVDDYLNNGAAHPNIETDTILWNTALEKRISIRPFFKESATNGPTLNKIAKAIRAALAEKKKQRGGDHVDPETNTELANVQPDLLKMGAVSVVRSTDPGRSAGLNFHFSAEAVGIYAEGSYNAFVPWQTFKDDLSPDGAALFGGARPKADEDKD